MIKIVYDAQTKEVTEVEVPDEEMPTIEETIAKPTTEEKLEELAINVSMAMEAVMLLSIE